MKQTKTPRTLSAFLLLTLLNLFSTTALASTRSFHFSFPQPDITEQKDITTVKMRGTKNYAKPGRPLLPIKQVEVLVPFGTNVKNIQIHTKRTLMGSGYTVEWAQAPRPLCTDTTYSAQPDTKPDPRIYMKNTPYPAKTAEIISTARLYGYNILIIHLHPVQYLPLKKTLYYMSDIYLTVEFEDNSTQSVSPLYRYTAWDEKQVMRRVVNPDDVFTYPSSPAPTKNTTSSLVDPSESYDYVIVTPQAFVSAFQRLADYKNSIGVATKIVSTEDIYNDYTGTDRADKIRNFVKDAYQNWGIKYLLLGGDDYDDSGNLLVPVRGCYLQAGSKTASDAPCDIYFGGLDGNWDNDGDGRYGEAGEVDYYTEVHVGRVTADTVEEINRWIDKDLYYEQHSGHPHLNRALWLGEKLDAYTWGSRSKDKILPLLPDAYQVTTLYDRNGTWSRNDCINELNKGPHLVNHLGHASYSNVEKIYRSDVDNLTNDFYFFNYSQGCNAGGFDQDYSGNGEAISEHFIFAQNAAFAVVMNARYGWYTMGGTNGPSQAFDYEFFDAIFTEGIRNLGAANDDSREDNAGIAQNDNYYRWCYLELNLHGDPHTPIQSEEPMPPQNISDLNIDPDKSTLHWGEDYRADRYDVVRGDLRALFENRGDFSSSVTECLKNDCPTTSTSDPDSPSAGEGFYYLVRGQRGDLNGTYNSDDAGQTEDRDSEIESSPNHCP